MAQAITINPATLDIPLREQLVSEQAFFVNGPLTQGLTPEMAEKMYPLGPMSRTLITLTALRMHAAGLFDLDEPIARTLPHILEKNPFNVAITPRHLLTETAGFAVPPINSSYLIPFRNHTTQVRTAGQMAHADVVGWQLLTQFLRAKGEADIYQLIDAHLFSAMIEMPARFSGPVSHMDFEWLSSIELSADAIAELARFYIRNRDKNGARFLPDDLYAQLVKRHNWRMHPIGPRRTLGGKIRTLGARTYISPPAVTGMMGPTFMAFPDQGIAFVSLDGITDKYLAAVSAVAADRFLPAKRDNRLSEAQGLRDASDRFSGKYVLSTAPSAWLKERLDNLETNTLQIEENASGAIVVETETSVRTYAQQAPFYYRAADGEDLILSPYRQGGYMVLGGTLYHYVGVLGAKPFVLDAFPLVMLMLLSSAVYLRSKTSSRWPKMARFAVLGTVLVAAGLAGDYYFWPKAVFVWDMPWLVNLWRIALNIGLALVLSLPLFAMAFTKKNEMPEGAAILVVPLHLALLSISAVALFLILVAWGVAGEISAY